MKKKLLFTCLIGLLFSTSAYAKCDGGTEVGSFCLSNVTLNWWSASSWCKANEREMATIYDLCPNWDGNEGSNKCPELNGKGSNIVWSATVSSDDAAFTVVLSNGTVYNHVSRNYIQNVSALCRQVLQKVNISVLSARLLCR